MTTFVTEIGRPQRRRVADINDVHYKGGHHDNRTGDGCLLLVWKCQDARGDAK